MQSLSGNDAGLTIAGHADGQAFLEAAVLTAVAVQSDDQALAVSQAAVLDLLLDTPPEEALYNELSK